MTNKRFDAVKIQFEKFLSSIGNTLTSENEVNIIRNKLRRHFNTTASGYLCSNQFIASLNQIHNIFIENNKSTKYFTLLASFDEQLKKHVIKLASSKPPIPNSSSSTTPSAQIDSTNETIEEILLSTPTESSIEYIPSITAIQETIEYLLDQCCNISSQSSISEPVHLNTVLPVTTDSTNRTKHHRKIIKLERRLSRLSRTIRNLEEKDMSLDEMAHCDLYVVESNLKKRACEIYAKLAELKSQPSSIERIIHQPISLNASETGHPLVSQDLEDMINQSKHFPSFNDVLNTVEKANDKYKLNLNEENRRSLAEKSFKIIGKQIKDRRMADFHDIMSSRLPEDFNIEQNDPALHSAEIEMVLLENEREANIKTEKIFEEYSQIHPDPAGEVDIASTEGESANESEEQPETELVVETHEIQYDVVDINPSLPSESLNPITPELTSVESAAEISLNDRTVTILSTASLPMRRSTYNRELKVNDGTEPSSSIDPKECHVQSLTPRRKSNLTDNEIIYKLYRQKLTNDVSLPISNDVVKKRPLTKHTEYSNVKKVKQQTPELIVLD